MKADSRLMDMLAGYAAAHQHPVNVAVHMIGIPTIMFGALVAASWFRFEVAAVPVNAAYLLVLAFFVFYLTLDRLFAAVFLVLALPIAWFASSIGNQPLPISGTVAAAAFGGGYLAQFAGHAVEKSPAVVLRHPVRANLAAPFFTVVEAFKLLGLRDELFAELQQRVAVRRAEPPAGR